MSILCNFCQKCFATKSNLNSHQKTAKYCLQIQGKNEPVVENTICTYCEKKFSTVYNLKEHMSICKDRQKDEKDSLFRSYERDITKYRKHISQLEEKIEKYEKKYEEKICVQKQEYEEKMLTQKQEYEDKILTQKKEYEEKLNTQRQEYEVKYDKQQNVINTIAMKPSTTKTMNVIHNNHQHINFNDRDRLNDVIKNNVNQSIVKKGQEGLASVVYNKYLKDEQGNKLYRVVDTSRQNFEYIDETGEVRMDIGEKKLTDAISKSDLTKHVSAIAKDMPNLYENNGHLDSVIQLTNFEEDNSKFRKEMVRLSKSDK